MVKIQELNDAIAEERLVRNGVKLNILLCNAVSTTVAVVVSVPRFKIVVLSV